jgi:hypothetical protein
MSKKKNTLQDLDEFLKQQAATLVPPEKLSEKVEEQNPVHQQATIVQQPTVPSTSIEISQEKILHDLKKFSEQEGVFFRKKFYELIVKSLEAQPQSLPHDKMLINTALYLQAGDDWKEVIREYWRRKSAQ